MQGEPLVADARPFYNQLQQRLEQTEPLATEALVSLGAQSAATTAPAGISGEVRRAMRQPGDGMTALKRRLASSLP